MKKQRSLSSLSILILSLILLLVLNFQTTQSQEPEIEFAPAPEIVLKAANYNANTIVEPMNEVDSKASLAPQSATFDVTYVGFTPQAEAAFQYAVDLWSMQISSPQVIRIQANWTTLGAGTLGSASSNGIVRYFPNSTSSTWYSQALADKLCNCDVNGGDYDIVANFNSTYSNWYLGIDGMTPAGDYDLATVILHEIGHGLGFSGLMNYDDGTGSTECAGVANEGCWGTGTPISPSIYDRFTEDLAGNSLINTGVYANPSATLGSALLSGNVYFNSPNAVVAAGGRPPLYAPPAWDSGSSYSHLDETTYPAGDPNSLMTPQLGTQEAIHDPGQIALCMFVDMGWDANCQAPAIDVTPTEIDSVQLVNTQTNQSLTISNNGVSNLDWVIEEDDDVAQVVLGADNESAFEIQEPIQSLMTTAASVNLILDDGSPENALGIGPGGAIFWLNQFTPDPADFPFVLDEIQIWSNAPVGELLDIYVYEDFDSDITNGATHRLSLNSVAVQSADVWSSFIVDPPLQLNGLGDVLIGVLNTNPTEGSSARLDETTSQGRSWLGFGGAPYPIPVPIPPPGSWDMIDNFGFPGNWMIRGVGRQNTVCVTPSDISWASVSATSGTVAATGSSMVDVTLDATGLNTGVHTGTICVDSNDPITPQVQVPLTLTVVVENTWLGNTTDWHTISNWSLGIVPTETHAVTIPTSPTGGNMPLLSAGGAVDRITIEPDASLDLSTQTFTAETAVTNSGKISQTIASMPADVPNDFLHIQNMASDEDKYFGVIITPTLAMGQTSVGIRGNSNCTTDDPGDSVDRCFDIVPGNSVSSDIRFYYLDGEEDSEDPDPANLFVWHWGGSFPWDSLGSDGYGTISPDYNWVEVEGVSSYSPFVLAGAVPTAVTFRAFNVYSNSILVVFLTFAILGLMLTSIIFILRRKKQPG